MSDALHLTLTPDLDEIDRLTEAVHAFAEDRLPDHVVDALDLIIDELLTNTIRYGFADGRPGGARVRLRRLSDRVVLEIVDDGLPFDPLDAAAPDLTASLEDRAIGGWGLHLVRQSTHALAYELRCGLNHLRAEILLDADPFAGFADIAEDDDDEDDDGELDADDAPPTEPQP